MNQSDNFEGPDFDDKDFLRDDDEGMKEKYSERSERTVRIIRPPADGSIHIEGGEESAILSDGEKGEQKSSSGKTLYRLDCGCLVDDLRQTRREGDIYVCVKHALYCRLCSLIVLPSDLVYIRLNESYYHKGCALNVIRKVLFENELRQGVLSPETVGELKAIRNEIMKRQVYGEVKRIGHKVKDIFSGYKTNGLSKKR